MARLILVIDDEIPILKVLQLILVRNGFVVETAENGEEGLEKINCKNYSLILTDIKMPGISGNHVLEYVKGGKKNSTPVIGMSGTPWLFEQNNFDAVIAKPFTREKIMAVINQLIEN